MKTIFSLLTALLISTITFAQGGINYKALIKDANGDVVTNQAVTIQFQILEGGTANVYQETHTPSTDVNGLVVVNIGEGTVDSGNFVAIDWGSDNHFLNVQVDTGDGLTDLGTTQFTSVPYANYAEVAGALTPQPHKITNLNYPDGYEGMQPVVIRRFFPYSVPSGKNLYITHILGIEGAAIKIQGAPDFFPILNGNESANGFQSLTQAIIIASGETVEPLASTTRAFGFIVDAHVTPIYSDTTDYTVPTDKILIITNTRSDIRFFNTSNQQDLMYLGNGNSQTVVGRSSFFQPIPIDEGTVIRGDTWSGYLMDKE